MGRPINKRFFRGLDQDGFQVGCSAWFTGEPAPEDGYLTQQKTNHKYRVQSKAGPGARVETLTLVDGPPAAEGEMSVAVSPASGGTKYAKTFGNHQVKTFDGFRYVWPSTGQGSASGLEEANLQEATTSEGDPLDFMIYYNSVYDSANDRILMTAYNEFGDPPIELGSFIAISDDGGATFTQTLLYSPDMDDFVEKWHILNNAASSEYVAVAARSNGKPRVIVASHANPTSWSVRSTISDLADFDNIIRVAHNGAGTIVCIGNTDADPNDLFIVTSTDSGATWTLIDYDETAFDSELTTPPFSPGWVDLVYDGSHFISAVIVYDQSNNRVVWSTSSTDGASWADVEISTTAIPHRMAVDGAGATIIICKDSTDVDFTVLRTTNNGTSWTETADAGDGTDQSIDCITHDPVNDRYVMHTLDTGSGNADNIYVSNAAGTSWTFEITTGEELVSNPATISYVSSSDAYVLGAYALFTIDSAFTGFTTPTQP